MVTYKTIIDKLEEWTTAHHEVNGFDFGESLDPKTLSDKDRPYPMFFVFTNPVQFSPGQVSLPFTIAIFSQTLQEGETTREDQRKSTRQVISDSLQIARDLIAEIRHGDFFDFDESNVIEVALPASAVPFEEKQMDNVSGVEMSITITVFEDYDACSIPRTGTTPPTQGDCDPVTILDPDGQEVTTVPSGGNWRQGHVIIRTLPGGNQLANVDPPTEGDGTDVIYDVPGAIVENSDGDQLQVVDAGSTYEVPDSAITNHRGEPITSLPAGDPFQVDKATVRASDNAVLLELAPGDEQTLLATYVEDTEGNLIATLYPRAGENIHVQPDAPTPSGICYPPVVPLTRTSFRTGDCPNLFDGGTYDVTPPTYPAAFAQLDYQATQGSIRGTAEAGTSLTDSIAPTFLKSANKFSNKYRFTDDQGNFSDASAGGLWKHVNFVDHSYTGAEAGLVLDHLYRKMFTSRYVTIDSKFNMNSTDGKSWEEWIDAIVALGTYKGFDDWRVLDCGYGMQGPMAAYASPNEEWSDNMFTSSRSDNRTSFLTGESYDGSNMYAIVDTGNADVLVDLQKSKSTSFQQNLIHIYLVRDFD